MLEGFINSLQKKWSWINIIIFYVFLLLLIQLLNTTLFGVEILESKEGYTAGLGLWVWSFVGGFIAYHKTRRWLKALLIFLILLFTSSPVPAVNFVLFALLLRWERGSSLKSLFTLKKLLLALGLFVLAFILVGFNDFIIRLFLIDTTAGFYTTGALLFTITSLFLYIKSKKQSLYYAEQLRNEVYKALFKASLWGTAGFLFTAIGYWNAALQEGGGTYYALWGLMLIGAFDFIRIAYKYAKELKPVLDKYSKEEQIYLENFYHILGRFLTQDKREFIEYLQGIGISEETAHSIYESLLGNFSKETKEEYEEKLSIERAFEILGIAITKDIKTIKNAYRRLAKVFHPDVKESGDAAKFIEINKAYETALTYAEGR